MQRGIKLISRLIADLVAGAAMILSVFPDNYVLSQTLTIYHNDFGLYQKEVQLPLSPGRAWHWMSEFPRMTEPNSILLILLERKSDVLVLEQKIINPILNNEPALQRWIGKRVEVIFPEGGSIIGMLRRFDHPFLSLADESGKIHFINTALIQRISAGDSLIGDQTELSAGWKMMSKNSGKIRFSLSYFLSGISWQADYIGIYSGDAGKLSLTVRAFIENHTGDRLMTSVLRLVAGDVPKNVNNMQPTPFRLNKESQVMGAAMVAESDAFERRELHEYHVYELSDSTVLEEKSIVMKNLSSVPGIPVKKRYTYDGGTDGKNVRMRLSFFNSGEIGLGQPLPKGNIRLYGVDDKLELTYLAGDFIPPVSKDQKVEMSGGISFNISGERIQTDFRQISRTIMEEDYKITLHNSTAEAETIYVLEHMRGDWSIIKNSHPFHAVDSHTVEFVVPVEHNSDTLFRYSVKIQ